MAMMGFYRWLRLKKAQLYTKTVKSDFGAFGSGSIIVTPFLSYNPKAVYVGKDVAIYSGCWLDGIAEYAGKRFQPRLEIGEGASIGSGAHFIACGRVSIGRNVVIAQNVYISDNLHGYEDLSQGIMAQPLVSPGPVIIEDEVWLGEGVCVLPNVTIGRHSVIGSNAVVTSSIPAYSVAVGVPAKVIRQYNQQSGRWERV